VGLQYFVKKKDSSGGREEGSVNNKGAEISQYHLGSNSMQGEIWGATLARGGWGVS